MSKREEREGFVNYPECVHCGTDCETVFDKLCRTCKRPYVDITPAGFHPQNITPDVVARIVDKLFKATAYGLEELVFRRTKILARGFVSQPRNTRGECLSTKEEHATELARLVKEAIE